MICGTNDTVVQNPAAVPNTALKCSPLIRPSQNSPQLHLHKFSNSPFIHR
jgi:hypothetical protein